MSETAGHFTVIGVGPGDPGLMTLKATEAIRSSDLLYYPKTETGSARARTIAAPIIDDCPTVTEVAFVLPMYVDPEPAQAVYAKVAQDIESAVQAGKAVGLLCEGDPLLYGSAIHLIRRLKDTVPMTIIPGVTASTACAAEVQVPLGIRNDAFAIIPATLPSSSIETKLMHCDTAAIIKLGRHKDKVMACLEKLGLMDAAHMIGAPKADQQPERLSQDDDADPGYFSMILVSRHTDAGDMK